MKKAVGSKKKIRRSKKKNSEQQNIRLVSINARGIKSKLCSLKQVARDLEPDIVALQETHLREEEKISIQGYEWIEGNRSKQSGGGVGFLVCKNLLRNVIREPSINYPDKMEVRWVRLILKDRQHLCMGVFYGKQETYQNQDTLDEYNTLENQINSFLAQNHQVILLGDFNAKVGNDSNGISGGDPAVSRNGKMLLDLIQNTQTVILNSQPFCTGKWTRVNTKNTSERSILDYVIVSPALLPFIKTMAIDEAEEYKLFSRKSKSDHNCIYLDIQVNFPPSDTLLKQIKWKITMDTDWKQFDQAVASSPVINTAPTQHESATMYYQKWSNHLLEIATATIGQYPTSKKYKRPFSNDSDINSALVSKQQAKQAYIDGLKSGTNNGHLRIITKIRNPSDNI